MGAEIGLDRAPAGHFQFRHAPKRRQILRLEAQRLDDQIGLFDVVRALDQLGALPPGGIGRAKAHLLHHHALDGIAGEALGRGQPDELHALFLGILHLALRARHVRPVAAVQALHEVAPCRIAVRTQSIAVSPPPITTTRLPSAFSSPDCRIPAPRRRSSRFDAVR
jgi:hypothetical protein